MLRSPTAKTSSSLTASGLWSPLPLGSGAPSRAPTPLQLPPGHRQQSISSWRDLQAFPIAFHFVAHEETEGPSAPSPSRGTQHMKGVDLELASPVWHLPPQPAPLTSPCLEKSRGWGEGRGTHTSTEGKCGPPPAPGTTALFGACLLLRGTHHLLASTWCVALSGHT